MKDFYLMNNIANYSYHRDNGVFYELAKLYSKNIKTRKQIDEFKTNWDSLNRENIILENFKGVDNSCKNLFEYMSMTCRSMIRRTTKI
jgi:hypothetical protein